MEGACLTPPPPPPPNLRADGELNKINCVITVPHLQNYDPLSLIGGKYNYIQM